MVAILLDNSSNRQAPICLRQLLARFSILHGMTTAPQEAQFNERLCARVHKLRNDRGWTADQMATALGVPADRYRKYEYRSPLPAYLMERFAIIVGCDLAYLLTGKSTIPRKTAENQGRKSA